MNKKVTIILLFFIFLTPGLAAIFLYQHPQWLPRSTVNHGRFVSPAIPIKNLTGHKWGLILWNPNECKTDCLKNLDKIARIRLALGRHLYEVNQWLLIPNKLDTMPPDVIKSLKEQEIGLLDRANDKINHAKMLSSKPAIFIANPQGYLILQYPTKVQSKDVFHDLKQLLTIGKSN